MKVDIAELLHKAEQLLDKEYALKAESLILDPESRIFDSAPTRNEVGDLLATLRIRQITTSRGGKRIYGLPQLIMKLEQMGASSAVLRYGFISPKLVGSILFFWQWRGSWRFNS